MATTGARVHLPRHAGGARDSAICGTGAGIFRTQQFFYTSPAAARENQSTIFYSTAQLLLRHYASAFVFSARRGYPRASSPVPCGELNPFGNYMIVRQSERTRGPRSFEIALEARRPTGAVSPFAVESGIAAAIPATDPLPLLVRGDSRGCARCVFPVTRWLTLESGVLGLTPTGSSGCSPVLVWIAQRGTLRIILVSATVVITAGSLSQSYAVRQPPDPTQSCHLMLDLSKLARFGRGTVRPRAPPFRDRAARQLPDSATAIRAITQMYINLRYGTLRGKEPTRRLKQLVAELRV